MDLMSLKDLIGLIDLVDTGFSIIFEYINIYIRSITYYPFSSTDDLICYQTLWKFGLSNGY